MNREQTPTAETLWSSAPVIALPSHNEFETFPEFPQPIDNEASSAMDETMSIATNTSDDDQQFVVLDTPEDDVFNNADVVVGEEAIAIDECIKTEQQHQVELSKHLPQTTQSGPEFSRPSDDFYKGPTNVGVQLNEKIDQVCGEVYSSINMQSNRQCSDKELGTYESAQLKFQLDSPADRTTPSLKAQVRGMAIDLDEEIVSHLAPFLLDEDKIETPLNLKVTVTETNLLIKDWLCVNLLPIISDQNLLLPSISSHQSLTERARTREKERTGLNWGIEVAKSGSVWQPVRWTEEGVGNANNFAF
uniref:Uncharacterized protein n=1 Tax=Ascaris lumbricoides TaxID=6252 RepID=A0A9J2P4Y7_ASCLU